MWENSMKSRIYDLEFWDFGRRIIILVMFSTLRSVINISNRSPTFQTWHKHLSLTSMWISRSSAALLLVSTINQLPSHMFPARAKENLPFYISKFFYFSSNMKKSFNFYFLLNFPFFFKFQVFRLEWTVVNWILTLYMIRKVERTPPPTAIDLLENASSDGSTCHPQSSPVSIP